MRTLSNTENGGKVVELTRQEWRELVHLAKAVDGKTIDDLQGEHYFGGLRSEGEAILNTDYSGMFGAIRAFYESNFVLNELKQLVGRYDKYMAIKGEK
jgi:hypothetical protein